MKLTAYQIPEDPQMRLGPAPIFRDWMAGDGFRALLGCKATLRANRSGWLVLAGHDVEVIWNGGDDPSDLEVTCQGFPPFPAASHFGHGILTWGIRYLFRTPPGFNLLARGPTNYPKDGIFPLEGIIEADWSAAPFTMNWKVTRADRLIRFKVGEPICMITPLRRGQIEQFHPHLASAPSLTGESALWPRLDRAALQERGDRLPDDALGSIWQLLPTETDRSSEERHPTYSTPDVQRLRPFHHQLGDE